MSQAEEHLATDLCRTGGAACWRWIAVMALRCQLAVPSTTCSPRCHDLETLLAPAELP